MPFLRLIKSVKCVRLKVIILLIYFECVYGQYYNYGDGNHRFSQPHPQQQYLYPTPHNTYSSSSPLIERLVEYGTRQIQLPSMSRVSETLGVLGSMAMRRFLISKRELKTESSFSNNNNNASLGDNEELGQGLLALSKSLLLGEKNGTQIVPKFLPPLIYRDGRIILGSSNSSNTNNGGEKNTAVCTTPGGQSGKCLDISGCPGLLLDLQKLRKSLCFKALFVPGVCCPNDSDGDDEIKVGTTLRPVRITTTRSTTKRPNLLESLFGSSGTVRTTTEKPIEKSDQCGRPENPSFRIVGGEKSVPGNWPWMAAIFLHGPKGTEFWCGGSLISKKYVLTAAHCTKDQKQKSFSPRQFTIRLGDYDLALSTDPSTPTTYRVVKITAHPDFNGIGFYNDVALLELDREVDYNRFISPVCLPTARNKHNNFQGTFPTVIGWGTNKYGGREHTALQEVKLPVWGNSDCDRAYFQPITGIFLCAGYKEGGRDACQGDSGGPLMLEMEGKWVQIGIVSFGNRCAEPGYPGVYTRLTEFTEWIGKNMK